MKQCKITVIKKHFNQDLAKTYCEGQVTSCPVFEEGQEFVYSHFGEGNKPSEFCESAWHDLYKNVMTLCSSGSFKGWMKKKNVVISCCTDGIRPVVFKLEAVESK